MREPETWPRFAFLAGGATLVALLVNLAVRALPSLWDGAWPPSDFAALAGNVPGLVIVGIYTLLFVGLTEELMFHSYLLSRIAWALGGSSRAWWWAVAIVSVIFGVTHGTHGFVTVLNATAIGFLYGAIYLRTGRNLSVVIVTHSLYDTIRLLQLAGG